MASKEDLKAMSKKVEEIDKVLSAPNFKSRMESVKDAETKATKEK